MSDPITYSVEGVAAATGLSTDVIRRAHRAGDLPSIKAKVAGRTVEKPLFTPAAVRAWLGIKAA